VIDSHAHLNLPQFDADRPAVIARATEAGVTTIVNVGADLLSSQQSVEMAGRYPFIYAAVGVHPHDASTLDETVYGQIRELARHPRVVAIGEIGLDYYYNFSPREQQVEAFELQLDLSVELGLPFIIHDREAHGPIMSALDGWLTKAGSLHGVLHCFSGDAAMARRAVDMGLYISIAGPVTFHNARQLPQVVKEVPLTRLLVETDCPYLAPMPHRGKRNEPAYVCLVAQAIAAIKSVDVTEVDAVTSQNVRDLFGRMSI
jgi:TatD DNase family protein